MSEPVSPAAEAAPESAEAAAPALSVVIPAYNERQRLGASLAELDDWLSRAGRACEVVVVDDGSDDGTADRVHEQPPAGAEVRVLVNTHNRGKGASVRRGVLASRGQVVVICDADMNVPAAEIDRLLGAIDAGADVAIGSRPIGSADVKRSRLRNLTGWAFRTLRQAILLPDIGDTQCGFKAFSRAAADTVFPRQSLEGYGFDLEVLAIARHLDYRIDEVAVHWSEKPGSKVRPLSVAITLLRDVLRVRWRWGGARKGPRVAGTDGSGEGWGVRRGE